MTPAAIFLMKTYPHLYGQICSRENLELAFRRARKRRSRKQYVIDFEKDLMGNLQLLQTELLFHSYCPRPLQSFILRDPKTRKISKSNFRDRIVHHALCNVIGPLLEKKFIYDSYANRVGKGTLNAIERFHFFQRKVTKNNTQRCHVLKADIYHYFETVDHTILIHLLSREITDQRVLWLVRIILQNYTTSEIGKGMPLGNLTSQFFANVYLNELDQFVKQQLHVKYYLRYVDDFVIFERSAKKLEDYEAKIDLFLKDNLGLQLHPDKTKIIEHQKGIGFLGFTLFPHHKLLKAKNVRHFQKRYNSLYNEYVTEKCNYDRVYDFLEGWMAYAKQANTYNLRKRILLKMEERFPQDISAKEFNRAHKHL
nr:hypothetical protein [uncultured archaeon]